MFCLHSFEGLTHLHLVWYFAVRVFENLLKWNMGQIKKKKTKSLRKKVVIFCFPSIEVYNYSDCITTNLLVLPLTEWQKLLQLLQLLLLLVLSAKNNKYYYYNVLTNNITITIYE